MIKSYVGSKGEIQRGMNQLEDKEFAADRFRMTAGSSARWRQLLSQCFTRIRASPRPDPNLLRTCALSRTAGRAEGPG